MKQASCTKNMLITIVFSALITLCSGQANADFTFGEPINMGPTLNSTSRDEEPGISSDGLSLYYCSTRPGGFGGYDLWLSNRETTQEDWSQPINLGSTVNTSSQDFSPDISNDGLELYFGSNRSVGYGNYDIWVAKRETIEDNWGTPVNLGSLVNKSGLEGCPAISNDGLELYFWSDRSGGHGSTDIWVSRRATINDDWGIPVNLGHTINGSSTELCMDITVDGLCLVFVSTRSGGYGGTYGDIWMTKRPTKDDPWELPVNPGVNVNSSTTDNGPFLSTDGSILYFSSERPGGSGEADMWQVSIEPIVDFNSDGNIDTDDLLILIDNWNTDESLCDIGPMPWGDGVVDMKDLEVFIENWEKKNFINVDEDDDGSQVTLKQGQRLVVTLESNPSTGYSWELVENQDSILEQIGEVEYIESEQSDPPMVGVPGQEIFRFKAVSTGQQTLELLYRRPWETDVEPAKTFSIEVIVN